MILWKISGWAAGWKTACLPCLDHWALATEEYFTDGAVAPFLTETELPQQERVQQSRAGQLGRDRLGKQGAAKVQKLAKGCRKQMRSPELKKRGSSKVPRSFVEANPNQKTTEICQTVKRNLPSPVQELEGSHSRLFSSFWVFNLKIKILIVLICSNKR